MHEIPFGSAAAPAMKINFGRLRRLIRKEVSEILRDRRTILTLILMPLLLYPLLMVGFRQFFLSTKAAQYSPIYRIGFRTDEEMTVGVQLFGLGENICAAQEQRKSEGDLSANMPQLVPAVVPGPDLVSEIHRGRFEVIVRFRREIPLRSDVQNDKTFPVELLFADESGYARDAATHLEKLCSAANSELLARMIRVPVAVFVPIKDPERPKSISLAVLVPLILILMTITGAVYPAIDLTAGERERGTLEILVAAPIPRLGVLFAKYVSVVIVAVLTALVNLVTMTVTLMVSGMGQLLFSGGLSVLVVLQVFCLMLLFAMFFSAVLLTLTSFARSFKEAQAYLIPLMLLALGPGLLSLVPGVKLQGPLVVAPLLNIVLLARDLFEGSASAISAIIVVVTTLLYALAALAVAARIFGAEAVLYSEQATWSDFYHRPAESRPTAAASGALLCLALLFPATFICNGIIGQMRERSLQERLTLQAVANVILFAGFPLFAAWRGRVWFRSGFRLGAAPWSSFGVALLLGLTSWALVHEILLLGRMVGIASLGEEYQALVRKQLESWREYPMPLIVLSQAVAPAVLEEFFFRGFLFSALLGALRPRGAIIASALLFGFFHLVLGGMLVVERLLPSTLLGLVLAWLCWKTGSVWPGVLLHVVHNSLLILLAYYEPALQDWGIAVDAQSHLPALWLALAGAGVAVGLFWCWMLPHRQELAYQESSGV